MDFILFLCSFYKAGLNKTLCFITPSLWINTDLFHALWPRSFDTLILMVLLAVTFLFIIKNVAKIVEAKSTSFNPAFKQTQPDAKLTSIRRGVNKRPRITIHNKERCTRAYSNKILILKKAFVTIFDETDPKKFKHNKVNLGKAFYWCFWGGPFKDYLQRRP